MAESITTDVFKFVAIRPVQRATEKETRRTLIRDERAQTPDGDRVLGRLARELAPPGAALTRWGELDLAPLRPFIDEYGDLVRHYEELDPEAPPPAGTQVLLQNRITPPPPEALPDLFSRAWDALYVAERTGADAGPRLEEPMAALRVLHFVQSLEEEANPPATDALTLLDATPAIPAAFYNALPAASPHPADSVPRPEVEPHAAGRSAELRRLAQELTAAQTLVEGLSTLPEVAQPVVQQTDESEGDLTRTRLSVEMAPSLRSLLSDESGPVRQSLLRRTGITEATPPSLAAQRLHGQLATLTEQAFELSRDPEFQSYVREQKSLQSGFDLGLVTAPGSYGDYLAEQDVGSAPEVNVAGRITPLGIGDLKVVKQTLLAYEPGEVAHIENVLKGEHKERTHRKLDRTETTVFVSEEETEETQRDTQSTDRFELKREAEQTIKEDMSIKAGLTVTAAFGPVVTTATGDFAYATAKQESQKNSANFAREVVERSVSKLQKKTKTERTTKVIGEVEEINVHGLDNRSPGTDHTIGIYRWVDKRYRAQVYNYGVRLLLEFIVPEPSAFYRAAQLGRVLNDMDAKPPEPLVSLSGQPLHPRDLDAANYRKYVAQYNAQGVIPPPPEYVTVGASIVKDAIEPGKSFGVAFDKFVIPEGYYLWRYSVKGTLMWLGAASFTLQVGYEQYPWATNTTHSSPIPQVSRHQEDPWGIEGTEVAPVKGQVPVNAAAYDVVAFAVNIEAECRRFQDSYHKWQLETYGKIYTAYLALQKEYEQKVAQARAALGIKIEGRNPGINRIIEKTELKKLCITMMTGQHFKNFNAMTDPSDKPKHYPEVNIDEALHEGRIIQFFEQAFEWEQMTYLYYPYFWGRKSNWVEINHITDPDPPFEQFLTAGAARVVVPVPMAYRDAVLFLLQHDEPLHKKVWGGGDRPTLDDPLYRSVAQEMKNRTDDLAGATPEGEPWEFTIPTTLVWLQPDSTLPSFT